MSDTIKIKRKSAVVLSFNPGNSGFISQDHRSLPPRAIGQVPRLPDVILPITDENNYSTSSSGANPTANVSLSSSPSRTKTFPPRLLKKKQPNSNPLRRKTLIRPERCRSRFGSMRNGSTGSNIKRDSMIRKPERDKLTCWRAASCFITCCFFPFCLSCCGMKDKNTQQAWREKVTLVMIIIFVCGTVGFLTFGLQPLVCSQSSNLIQAGKDLPMDTVVIHGAVFDISTYEHPSVNPIVEPSIGNLLTFGEDGAGVNRKDVSFLFQTVDNCKELLNLEVDTLFPCTLDGIKNSSDGFSDACHLTAASRRIVKRFKKVGSLFYDWNQIIGKKLFVFNSNVMDLSILDKLQGIQFPYKDGLRVFAGRDATRWIATKEPVFGICLKEILKVGEIDNRTAGCMISDIYLVVSLGFILGIILIRFVVALMFSWIVSRRLGKERLEREQKLKKLEANRKKKEDKWRAQGLDPKKMMPLNTQKIRNSRFISRFTIPQPGDEPGSDRRSHHNFRSSAIKSRHLSNISQNLNGSSDLIANDPRIIFPNEPDSTFLYTMMLVTCYSEGLQGISDTLTSLSETTYPSSHKIIIVIADGVITGSGETQSTPDICLSLLERHPIVDCEEEPEAHSYIAIADGKKRHNKAKVYCGYYKKPGTQPSENDETNISPAHKHNRCPMMVIVKCGNEEEKDLPKPGNRGKRDSQIILMNLLNKVMFNERMTPLEFEMFTKMHGVMGVTPDNFEVLLMVDADTKVYPDAVDMMVSVMDHDPNVMGLCGETKIANKTGSWVTAIQVFEYYISHHMAKAFESMFGGVTCLPGCFCCYRIKSPKGTNGYWVPILASPDIIDQYSENVVTTLHQKNLLLLGEDRFLTTLMLRAFPKRKMVFVPNAICKTVVPDEFKVLLSQRRRWINSTIHNLLELVLVRELCGIFCFSMQFVISVELIGTVVLPAAISFTLYLVVVTIFSTTPPIIPLILLAIILGLPAVLILFTTRKVVYILWMIIYIFSLPIWNLVLPSYAFWHFDDFSWGQTRMVEGEKIGESHGGKDGEFDSSQIQIKRWEEYERDRRLTILQEYKLQSEHERESWRSQNSSSTLVEEVIETQHDYQPSRLRNITSAEENEEIRVE